MAIHLLVDDREHAIIAELNIIAAESEPRLWSVKHLTCGDFQFITNNAPADPILTIERKTYSDLARSVRDGRIHNVASLDSLRHDHPKMKIALLLEGTRPRSEREPIGGIPYKTIRTAIHSQIFHYDVHIFETSDVGDTAKYLLDLISDISSFQVTAQSLQILANAQPATDVSVRDFLIARALAAPPQAPAPAPPLAPMLPQAPAPAPVAAPATRSIPCDMRSVASTTRAHRKSDFEFVRSLFCSCNGIGPLTAEKFIRSGISFSAFVRGLLPASCPSQLIKLSVRYREGRSTAQDVGILRQIGITEQMANELLCFANSGHEGPAPLHALCALSQNQLQLFRFKGRLQKAQMANVFKYLHYGENCDASAPAPSSSERI